MPALPWTQLLSGLKSRSIRGNVYSLEVQVLGEVEVGPYDQLLAFAPRANLYVLPVDVHHIVNGEHLAGTGWMYMTAPCVVLERGMHQQYHGRFSEVLPEYHGRNIADSFPQKEKLELYYDMFVVQTGWTELWTIAARILTGQVTLPPVESFLTM